MKTRVYSVRLVAGTSQLKTFILDTEPVGIISSNFHDKITVPRNVGVVVVTAEDGFDFTQLSGLIQTEELPANNLAEAWLDVPAPKRAAQAVGFENANGRPMDAAEFVDWEDSIVEYLREIGHPHTRLRHNPSARDSAFLESFE